MTLKEIYDGIKEVSPSICKNMEGTCDECPFGIWIEPDGYNCGFYLFQEQIENYAEIEEMSEALDKKIKRNTKST